MTISDPFAASLLAYRAAPFFVAGVEVRIGRRNAALDGVLAGMGRGPAFMITAWNPRGQRKPPAWNARAQMRLMEASRSRPMLAGSSGVGRWHEEQVVLVAPPPWLCRLGRRFGQRAVVALQRGRAPRLIALPYA